MRLAEAEMPGSTSTQNRISLFKLLKAQVNCRMLHMTIQTAVLIETLLGLGARNGPYVIFFLPGSCCCTIAAKKYSGVCRKGMNEEEFNWCISKHCSLVHSMDQI
jgi:adenosylhomocysteinase